jgi:PAS domain S-box-containing protein
MRLTKRIRLPWLGWPFVAMPLAVWLLLTITGTAALLWSQGNGRDAAAQRFQLRVGLMGDFVSSYVADLIDRERVAAETFLADQVVAKQDFTRSVAGFGYPAAVLLDDRGRVIYVAPDNPAVVGTDLTGHYAHLRTAVMDGQPAVSAVVPSAARGVPVVAFAVPFNTTSGRRVLSGAVEVRHSQLSSYLSTALSMAEVRIQLVDNSGAILAANRPLQDAIPALNNDDSELAAALRQRPAGRYQQTSRTWRYASEAIPGTPWRLSAAAPEDVLFASLDGSQLAGRAALTAAAVVGLLVVGAVARGRHSRHELQLSEQRFRNVFDNSRVGMVLTAPDGQFLRANPAMCQMLGHTQQDIVGQDFRAFTHPDDAEVGVPQALDCVAGRIDGFDVDKRYLHADEHVLDTSVTTTLIRGKEGQPQYFAMQIIDMTERRVLERQRQRNEAELAQHAEQLQHANAQMADFLAMLTHDVRQPLTNIVGSGELILEDWAATDDDTKRRYVHRMTTSGHQASNLVGEILTLAQLDAGALVARPVRLDVAHAVRETVTAYGVASDEPIAVVAPDQCTALADPTHLQLILGNLLGNATKYGGPPVTVTVTNGTDHVGIHVADHGEGIPDAFVPHLFDRFSRAETGVATTKTGTGLGLYFVHQLAHASGLTVEYRPNQPNGAVFTLVLPHSANPTTPAGNTHNVLAANS